MFAGMVGVFFSFSLIPRKRKTLLFLLILLFFIDYLFIGYYGFQIFRKEPFFYGHDNQDQLVKIAKASLCHCLCLE